jgi:hypothetical protein
MTLDHRLSESESRRRGGGGVVIVRLRRVPPRLLYASLAMMVIPWLAACGPAGTPTTVTVVNDRTEPAFVEIVSGPYAHRSFWVPARGTVVVVDVEVTADADPSITLRVVSADCRVLVQQVVPLRGNARFDLAASDSSPYLVSLQSDRPASDISRPEPTVDPCFR